METKTLYEPPPSKLLEIVEQIRGFQTLRLANELWDIGECILKEEKLWPKWGKKKYDSRMEFFDKKNTRLYQIDYVKEGVREEMTYSRSGWEKFCLQLHRSKFIVNLEEDEDDFYFWKKYFEKTIYLITGLDEGRFIHKLL